MLFFFQKSHRQHISGHKILDEKRHTCKICDKSFCTNFLLKKHERTHKKSDAKIPCDQCQRM